MIRVVEILTLTDIHDIVQQDVVFLDLLSHSVNDINSLELGFGYQSPLIWDEIEHIPQHEGVGKEDHSIN